MEVGGEDVGRITFELRADVTPKTAENFVSTMNVTELLIVGVDDGYPRLADNLE
jgi:cyclophilin family peptidyl-prolyl cis-trans isomerase